MDGLVDSDNFVFVKVLDVTVFFLDNTVGVDVGLLDRDGSLSAMAFLEAVSVILFSTCVKAFSVASEFGSNLSGSFSEIGSHGSLSSLVLSLGNLKFSFSSLEEFSISSLKVFDIGVIFLGKSFFSWSWKFSVIGGASGFIFNTGNHNSMGLFVPVSLKDIGINALGSNFLVAFSGDGKFIEENDVILSNWFHVFSENNVLSNFI